MSVYTFFMFSYSVETDIFAMLNIIYQGEALEAYKQWKTENSFGIAISIEV